MTSGATELAALIASHVTPPALPAAPVDKVRFLLDEGEDLESFVEAKFLAESVAHFLSSHPLAPGATVLCWDRLGGKQAVHTARILLSALSRVPRARLVYVASGTPPRGLGRLLAASLTQIGAQCEVLVETVSTKHDLYPVPDTLPLDALLDRADAVWHLALGGMAGRTCDPDGLPDRVARTADLNVLSLPDAGQQAARLETYGDILRRRPGFNHVRLDVYARVDGENTCVGHCMVGPGGDAQDRLWSLLETARPHPYWVRVTPMAHGAPAGSSLWCPSKSVVSAELRDVALTAMVGAGSLWMARGPGRDRVE